MEEALAQQVIFSGEEDIGTEGMLTDRDSCGSEKET